MNMCYNVGVRRDSLAQRKERNRIMNIICLTDSIISEAVNRHGEFALAQFDSCTDRDTWLNQI